MFAATAGDRLTVVRWLAPILCVTSAACATPRFGVGKTVNHVESPHFDAVGDLPVERLEVELIRLEQLYDVFTTYFQAQPEEHQRLPVVVMGEDEVSEFIDGAGGFVGKYRLEPVLVTSVGEDRRAFGLNTHELVHLLSSFALPHQPRWFAEGMATYLEDAYFESGGTIKMGLWRRPSEWVSIDELLTWELHPKAVKDEWPRYESARALLFFLANRDEPRLMRLVKGLRTRQPLLELYAEVFPPEERVALLERAKAFIEEERFSAWRTSLVRTAAVTRLAPLEPWEVELVRMRVFEAAGRTSKSLEALFAARAAGPIPMPTEIAAELVWRDWPAPADPAQPLVQLALSDAIDRSFLERLAAAEAATAGLPNSAFAWHRLSVARLWLRDAAGALSAVERAASLAPQARDVLLTRVEALVQLNRCVEARAGLVTAMGVSESPNAALLDEWEDFLARRCPP